ncbi:serine/threonine-protein kinase yakA [Biomphalaria glabrata]|nr:serine/threonine-protein kinase yakA [Biomphalaria glabrata]
MEKFRFRKKETLQSDVELQQQLPAQRHLQKDPPPYPGKKILPGYPAKQQDSHPAIQQQAGYLSNQNQAGYPANQPHVGYSAHATQVSHPANQQKTGYSADQPQPSHLAKHLGQGGDYQSMQLRPEPNGYQTMQLHPHAYSTDQKRIKQHTNWSGVLQDLFGLDSPHTAESTHESTSSGVASDVTSVYPATPTMTTFKGESVSSACSAKSNGSQDSGTKSASLSSSPKPEHSRQFLRCTRQSPAPPLPPVPSDPPPPLPAKHPLRMNNAPSQVDNNRGNSYSESPTNPSRVKKLRERRTRMSEQDNPLVNNDPKGWGVGQVRSSTPQRTNTCYACNNSEHRGLDTSMYNDINNSFAEALREEQYIETFANTRFIDPQDAFSHKDRVNMAPSPVSPVPPGGYYYNRDNALGQQEIWLNELVNRDPKMHPRHHQQQQMQQYHQQQKHLRIPQQQHTTRTSSPMRCDKNAATTQELQNGLGHPPNKFDRGTPIGHNHNLSRPGSAMNNAVSVSGARQGTHLRTFEQTDSLSPKQPNVFQTQAQVHHSGQHEDRPAQRADSRMRLSNGHADVVQQTNNYRSPGLINGVKNMSLSQVDISTANSPVMISKGKRQMSKSSPFECLPNDLLLKIFFHLPTDHLCRCAQVCRQWYNAVWDNPALWTSIVINNPNIDIDRALKYLTRRLSYNTPKICMILEKININFCSRLTDRGLQTAVKRCPELRYLDMQECHLVTNEGVTEAVSRCVNLERLDVTGCPKITCITLMDSVISQSPSNHLERIYLRYLDMTDCPHITDQDLMIITSQCTQLLFFYLRRCPLITDLGVSYIANNCTSLRELSMSDCLNITDLAMRELAKLRDNLRYLSVAKCEKVSDEGVINIAKNCSKLRYLNVRGCEAVSDIGLEFLARNCPRLRSLDIGKCDITDVGLYALSSYCPQLKKLGVKSCDAITDKGIVVVAFNCHSLQQLHVQDCCLSADAYAVVRKYCKRAIIEHTNPGVL